MRTVFYNNLTKNDKAIYDAVVDAIKAGKSTVSISGFKGSSLEMVKDIDLNNPELFWLSQRSGVVKSLLSSSVALKYAYDSRTTKRYRVEIEKVSTDIINKCINDHQSDYDKVLALHDYLKRTIQYDEVSYRARLAKTADDAHTIIGPLLKKKGVCEGFAKSLKYLCDKIGVECHCVNGTGSSSIERGGHAWNIVRINGYYHHVDVTWDNQFVDDSRVPMYAYLNLSDEAISKDHSWNRNYYPKCPDDPYNYFKMNRSLISSKTQLERFFIDNISLEESQIVFKVERGSSLEKEIVGCIDSTIMRASQKCKFARVDAYSTSYVPEQLVFSVNITYA